MIVLYEIRHSLRVSSPQLQGTEFLAHLSKKAHRELIGWYLASMGSSVERRNQCVYK